ncbi:hypothetical protein ID866_13364 [Astraeus odoratus]|nr:hypothetical protein ID866_13364 [Astraeus odoratus]
MHMQVFRDLIYEL